MKGQLLLQEGESLAILPVDEAVATPILSGIRDEPGVEIHEDIRKTVLRPAECWIE
jgi:hypothetical protein